MSEQRDTSRRFSAPERAMFLVIFAVAVVLLGLGAAAPDNSIRGARFLIAGDAFFLLGMTTQSVVGRRRGRKIEPLTLVSTFIFAVGLGVTIGRHPNVASHAVLGAVAVLFFLAPLPLLAVLVEQQGDEFQRTVLARSAVVALGAFVVGGLGYAILGRVYHFAAPDLLIVVPVVAGVWLVTYVVLWLMRT